MKKYFLTLLQFSFLKAATLYSFVRLTAYFNTEDWFTDWIVKPVQTTFIGYGFYFDQYTHVLKIIFLVILLTIVVWEYRQISTIKRKKIFISLSSFFGVLLLLLTPWAYESSMCNSLFCLFTEHYFQLPGYFVVILMVSMIVYYFLSREKALRN